MSKKERDRADRNFYRKILPPLPTALDQLEAAETADWAHDVADRARKKKGPSDAVKKLLRKKP